MLFSFVYGKKSDQERERPIKEIIFNRCPNPGAEKAEKIMKNLKTWLDKIRKSFRSDEGPDFEKFYEELITGDPVYILNQRICVSIYFMLFYAFYDCV